MEWHFYLVLILYILGLCGVLFKFPRMGFILVGAAFVLFTLTFKPTTSLFANPWVFAHVFFIFLSMAICLMSFLVGFFYVVQESRFKHKKIGGFFDRLPPLQVMDHLHYQTLVTGFVLFTLGIIAGAGWSKSTLGVYVTNDFRQLLSFAIWFFFAIYINLRTQRGWFGRRGVLIALVGLAALVALFIKFGNRGF